MAHRWPAAAFPGREFGKALSSKCDRLGSGRQHEAQRSLGRTGRRGKTPNEQGTDDTPEPPVCGIG